MSGSDQPAGDRCGKWMPRAKDYCGRSPDHKAECRTAAALADRRERLTERRRGQTLVTPEAKSRWNRAYKLKLMGLTPERFAQMLETQRYACAMCHEPFGEDQRICIDHDHACCPPNLPGRCCGKCVRGLLCLTCKRRCRVHRGVLRAGDDLPRAALRPASPQPAGRGVFFDTEEVTGSIPVSPTSLRRSEADSGIPEPASRSFDISLPSRHAGVLRQELNMPGTQRPGFGIRQPATREFRYTGGSCVSFRGPLSAL